MDLNVLLPEPFGPANVNFYFFSHRIDTVTKTTVYLTLVIVAEILLF